MSLASSQTADVSVETDIRRISSMLADPAYDGTGTVFQSTMFLVPWYETVGRTVGDPLLVVVRSRFTRKLIALLPLVRTTRHGCRIIEFADAGLSDYNFPRLGQSAPSSASEFQSLWNTLGDALTGSDLVRFTKMPHQVDGRPNPFGFAGRTLSCPLSSNVVTIHCWSTYLKSLERLFRKELRRSWRVFMQNKTAAFCEITEAADKNYVMQVIETQQRERFSANDNYLLDQPQMRDFYRMVAQADSSDVKPILTALLHGGEVVAALLGIANKDKFVMIRLASGTKQWAHCSPGRLVITQTMQMLFERGFRTFDFSIGNQPYKRRLGVKSEALFSFSAALNPKGWPLLGYDVAKDQLRRHKQTDRLLRSVLGRTN